MTRIPRRRTFRNLCVIPARLGSSRFPNKPLARLCGMTMIEHVYRRARMSRSVDEAVVATCDREIADAARRFGARVVMTSSSHQRASDRVAEVARSLRARIYVMVQGDEPLVTPGMIDASLEPFRGDRSVQCVNLAAPIRTEAEFLDPNTIKVVAGQDWDALYFSREAVPTRTRLPFDRIPALKQVCIIPFRREALLRFSKLPATPLETAESIDMLRFLEHGVPVRLVPIREQTQAVDTPQDLRKAERLMRLDPLFRRYRLAGTAS